jgi:hypothetical protein
MTANIPFYSFKLLVVGIIIKNNRRIKTSQMFAEKTLDSVWKAFAH